MTKKRLIDANGVIRYLANTRRFDEEDRLFTYDDVKQIIRNAPTVEAEPVRHGRWDEIYPFSEHGIPMASYECTNCGNDIDRQRGILPAYCEFCGARMDGGDDSASTRTN